MCGAGGFEDLEGTHERVIDRHHGPRIVKLSTVVGCREYRNELTPRKEFVSILDDLMRSDDEIQIVPTQKLADNVTTKGKGDSTVVFAPALRRNE